MENCLQHCVTLTKTMIAATQQSNDSSGGNLIISITTVGSFGHIVAVRSLQTLLPLIYTVVVVVIAAIVAVNFVAPTDKQVDVHSSCVRWFVRI